ncbi:MAG: PQQ-binding-like beta-propeller repeat protein [Sphingomonadaceae bacterium]
MKTFRTGLILGTMALALAGCGVFGGGGNKRPKTPTIGQRVAILTSESNAEVDPALTDVAILLPPAETNTEWTQPGGNGPKMMGHVGLGTSLGVAWTAKVDGTTKSARLAASPIVAEGKIFVVDVHARLHAFDANSGATLWVSQIGDANSKEFSKDKASLFGGGVSYDDGKLFATSGLGDVAAFNAADGKQIWKVRPGGPLRGAPSISNGQIYVMSQDNQIFALKESDGDQVWSEAASLEVSGVFGVGAPAVAQGSVVAGFSSGELNAYRYENGRSLWADALSRTSISTSVASLSDVDASPVIDRGRIFAIGQGGRMVSMELVTGQRLWEINVAGISTPWVAGEWVFVVDDQARLLCLSRATGKVRWVSQLPRYHKEKKKNGPIIWTGPILAGDRLIVASSEGQLANINPANGALQSRTKAGAPVFLPPIVANNTLYVLTNDGHLTAWR